MTTIADTADQAADQVKEVASHARSTVLDLSTQVLKLFNNARKAEERGVDTVLDRLGLQRRQSALVPVLWFAAGAVVAGSAVMLFAPTSGRRLRERISRFIDGEEQMISSHAKEMEKRVEEAVKTDAPASAIARPIPNGAKHTS